MEQKKYKLTKETMCFDGVTLHRIQALKDFGNVDAGELGGWVESEKNLSQFGDCWIAMEAKAYGGAEIGDNAILTRKAIGRQNGVVCACLKHISQKELNSLCQTIIKRSLQQSYISQANGRPKTLGLSIENYIKLQ